MSEYFYVFNCNLNYFANVVNYSAFRRLLSGNPDSDFFIAQP